MSDYASPLNDPYSMEFSPKPGLVWSMKPRGVDMRRYHSSLHNKLKYQNDPLSHSKKPQKKYVDVSNGCNVESYFGYSLVTWSDDNTIAFSTIEPLSADPEDEMDESFWSYRYPLYLIKPEHPQEVYTGV